MYGLDIHTFKYRHKDSTIPPLELQNPAVNAEAEPSIQTDSIVIKGDFHQVQ